MKLESTSPSTQPIRFACFALQSLRIVARREEFGVLRLDAAFDCLAERHQTQSRTAA